MHKSRLSLLVLTTVVVLLAMAEATAAKLDTKNLWSTINICDTHKHPNKLGVRGRMPNDGHKSHTLWMKFIAQYKNTNTHKWQKVTSTKFEKLQQTGYQLVADGVVAFDEIEKVVGR